MLKLDGEKTYIHRRRILKILKLDKNNQNGYRMTKPLPTGCIEQQKRMPIGQKFSMLLQHVDLDDKNRHLFNVDIRFNKEEATPKQHMYNEIYCPIFEKKKILDVTERSVFLLRETFQDGDKSYVCTKKIHATMLEKKFIPL